MTNFSQNLEWTAITSIVAMIVSIATVLFNIYKLKSNRNTWEQEQEISLNKQILFSKIKKRYELYAPVFNTLGQILDIEYPPYQYKKFKDNKILVKDIADKLLEHLYSEAGLFMEYTTRSTLLKTYQISYKFYENEASLNDLVDSYYYARRALRKDLEFDDSAPSKTLEEILKDKIKQKRSQKNNDFFWVKEGILAKSSRPGYPYKNVDINSLREKTKQWKDKGIKSIICLLSNEEIKNYYKSIDRKLNEYYTEQGFNVSFIPVHDFKIPPLNEEELYEVKKSFDALEKPVLIHCGSGEHRTNKAIEFLIFEFPLFDENSNLKLKSILKKFCHDL